MECSTQICHSYFDFQSCNSSGSGQARTAKYSDIIPFQTQYFPTYYKKAFVVIAAHFSATALIHNHIQQRLRGPGFHLNPLLDLLHFPYQRNTHRHGLIQFQTEASRHYCTILNSQWRIRRGTKTVKTYLDT